MIKKRLQVLCDISDAVLSISSVTMKLRSDLDLATELAAKVGKFETKNGVILQ